MLSEGFSVSYYLINVRVKDHVTTSIIVNTIPNVPKITNSNLGLYPIDIVLSLLSEWIPNKIVGQLT